MQNMFLGFELKKAGIKQVMDNQVSEWKTGYVAAVTEWLDSIPVGREFTSEAMRLVAERKIGKPHHPNAWAANAASILKSWLKDERIERTGMFVAATLASSHARESRQYRKLK